MERLRATSVPWIGPQCGGSAAFSIGRCSTFATFGAIGPQGRSLLVWRNFRNRLQVVDSKLSKHLSSAFGLWRAKLISNSLYAAGVGVVVLGVLGGTTWMSDGFWAPDGAYSRFVWPILSLAWVVGGEPGAESESCHTLWVVIT